MRPRILPAFVLLLSLCLPAGMLRAQFNWTGNSTNNGLVLDAQNWGGVAPTGVGTETFTFGATGSQGTVLFPTFAVASLTFGTNRPTIYSGFGTTPVLTIAPAGGVTVATGSTITFNSSLGVNLATGLTSGDDHVFNIGALTTLQINGAITGGGHLSKTGDGTLLLTGNNTYDYTGGLGFLDATSIHAGTVHLKGGSINHAGVGDIQISLGANDSGTLIIDNGGHATDYFGVLAQGANSTATAYVSGSTSYWNHSSGMDIGRAGVGTLFISSGADVTISGPYAFLGWTSTGVGTVNIDGAGSTWSIGGDVIVGGSGSGKITASNGAALNVNSGSSSIVLGSSASGATGILNIGAEAGNTPAAGGVINAATITTGAGSGTVQFKTTATSGVPYYLTKDGTSSGPAVVIAGTIQVINTAGYNVIGGINTYTAGTRVNGGTLELRGGSITHPSNNLIVGQGAGDNGDFIISNGADVSSYQGQIGLVSGASGEVTVTGSGSSWTNANYLYVGLAGYGTLDILNGGDVVSPDTSIGNNVNGEGEVVIDGAGSTLVNTGTLYVGSAGEGSLFISNGGSATNVTGSVGNNANGLGNVQVGGAGSLWTNTGNLVIGNVDDGYVQVYSQGAVTANAATLGALGSISGLLSVSSNATFTTAANLVVGGSGLSSLLIETGGVVAAGGQAIVANNSGSLGEVFLTGTGSALAVSGGDLYVGNAGDGSLYADGGATINVLGGAGKIHLGHTAGGQGYLALGYDGEGVGAGPVVNAAEITTGSGTGSITIGTNATDASPYYLTQNATSGGAPVIITGATHVDQIFGVNVLAGNSTYTGGTTISGGTLVTTNSNALGTGTVTLNNGALVVKATDLYNILVLNSGRLAGDGWVASASVGTSVTLAPGDLSATTAAIGTFGFDHLALAPNGTLEWNLKSATGAAGTTWDLVEVLTPSTLDITATSANKFTLKLISLNAGGSLGTATGFTLGQSYSWLMFQTDNIQGFDPTKFAIDSSLFTTNAGSGTFTLSKTGNNLFLNFSPVPEPSTYALLIAGLGIGGLGYLRRRGRAG